MKRRLSIAVVGLGVGNAHCELILQHPDKFDLVGVCDFDISKLDRFRDQEGICRTSSFEDILNLRDLDAMVIASFDEYHQEQIIACLDKGIHIFVEKPICVNREQFRIISKKTLEYPEVKISSNLILRKERRFINLKKRLQRGDLGKIYYVQCSYDYGRFYKITDGWRGRQPGYSVILGGAIHLIDLIYWLTDQKFIPDYQYSNNLSFELNNINFTDFRFYYCISFTYCENFF